MPALRVVIAGTDNPPIDIILPHGASARDLEDAVFESQSYLSRDSNRLRFIVAGKHLPPNTPTLERAGLTDGTFVHCVVSDIISNDESAHLLGDDTYIPCEYDDGMVTIDLVGDGSEHNIDDGSFHDWCWGFLLGALLGLIMMILAMDRSIALSNKWKRGVSYGAAVNVIFGVFLLATGRLH